MESHDQIAGTASSEERPPARDAQFWNKRESTVAAYSAAAFEQASLTEQNLALANSDLFAHLDQISKCLAQVLEQTADPLDQLSLIKSVLPEINKTTRELRAMTETMARLARDRGDSQRVAAR